MFINGSARELVSSNQYSHENGYYTVITYVDRAEKSLEGEAKVSLHSYWLISPLNLPNPEKLIAQRVKDFIENEGFKKINLLVYTGQSKTWHVHCEQAPSLFL